MLKTIVDNVFKRPYGWFVKTFGFPPVVSVAAIIRKGDTILLQQRGSKYYLVGGFVAAGELLKDALKREVMEETGLEISVGKLVGYYDDPASDPYIPRILFVYECSIRGGKTKSTYEGKSVFISRKKLPHLEYDGDKILKSYI